MRIFVVALLLALLAACSKPECETARDCLAGLVCENEKCVSASGKSVRPDTGPIDIGIYDTGTATTTVDAGVPPDGGVDGGMNMAGDAEVYDGGPTDATILPSSGLIVVAERNTGMVEIDDFAEMYDRTNATYAKSERTFPDQEGGDCTVGVLRLIAGAPLGVTAESIQLERTGGVTHLLLPLPNDPGRFEPNPLTNERLFGAPGDFFARIVSNGVAGSLANAQQPFLMPDEMFVTAPTPPGSAIDVEDGINFTWLVGPAQQTARIEAYDVTRTITLVCDVANDGMYSVPDEAIEAWADELPANRDAFVEISFIQETTLDAPLVGSQMTLPTKVRAQRSVRFDAE